MVGSLNPECPGLAPEAEIYVLKLFTEDRVSYTSWFLDAFNFVLENDIDIVNLSNGSSDFLDIPFIEKINELTANGVIVISAIGNEGPFQGTLNNPGDLINVIGIGSLDSTLSQVATFSSRGMTTWSLLQGMGNVKPDLVTAGSMILGLGIGSATECIVSSGTSVSASIVTASIALALSAIQDPKQREIVQNTAYIKTAMIRTAKRLKNLAISEQGSGVLDFEAFFDVLLHNSTQIKKPMVFPSRMDLRSNRNSTYFLPFSRQSFYASMMPIAMNLTFINPSSLSSTIVSHFYDFSLQAPENESKLKTLEQCLSLKFDYPTRVWPYFANMMLTLETQDNRQCRNLTAHNLEIKVSFIIQNLQSADIEQISMRIYLHYISTPERNKRILFDQFHSLKYPENGYILRDSLLNSDYPYEWNGDHLFTNFVQLHQKLTEGGFYLETLTETYSCFDALNYKVLLILDPEDFMSRTEINKLQYDYEQNGLSLVVVGDWYNEDLMQRNEFFNNNTFEMWTPFMGGANIPTINSLLQPYNVAFGQSVFSGDFIIEKRQVFIDSGTEIIRFPKDGYLLSASLNEESISIMNKGFQFEEAFIGQEGQDLEQSERLVPVIGVLDQLPGYEDSGRLVLLTDSSCVDGSSSSLTKCYWLIDRLIRIATGQIYRDPVLMSDKFHLRQDYQRDEEVKYGTVEDLDQTQLQQKMYKQSKLNSLSFKECKLKPTSKVEYDNDIERYQHQYTAKQISEWNQSPEDLLQDIDEGQGNTIIKWVSKTMNEMLGIKQSGGGIGIKIVPLIVTFMLLVFLLSYILRTNCRRCRKSDRPRLASKNDQKTKSRMCLTQVCLFLFPCCSKQGKQRNQKSRKFHILRREQANQLPQFREEETIEHVPRRSDSGNLSSGGLSHQSSRVSSVYDFSPYLYTN